MECVRYEDETVLVVHKPGGIPVQTRRLGEKDMVSILKNYRAAKREEPYIGIVHRLDQPVEGIQVFAKTKRAAAELSRQFAERTADKYYRAVVCNGGKKLAVPGDFGVLSDYLFKDGMANRSKVVKEGTEGAKRAVLRYTVLKTYENLAEVFICLETGRHHQIRVQMANAGFPLVGDKKYGAGEGMQFMGGEKNIALCSVKISFHHPKTGKKMEFETEPEHPVFQLLQHHPDIA